MKTSYYKWSVGIFLILLLVFPYFLILPSMATSPTIYDNYESEVSTGVINLYNQSSSAFQHIQELLELTNSTFRIVLGTRFNYSSNGASQIKIQAIDNSSGLIVSSQNLTIPNSNGENIQYTYYFLDTSYLLTRGSHLIRLLGLNSSPIGIHYTTTESGYSYYSNETTGKDNFTLDSKQYFVQFIEEPVVNLTSTENKTGRIDYPGNKDAIDAYLLYLPPNPVKIVLTIDNPNENLNLELYNYTNNGDMILQTTSVKTTGDNNPEILTYIPSSSSYLILLVKPSDYNNDVSNYTVYWLNSSNQIDITRPTVNFENSTMTLDITGVYASMDGFTYNGTSYPPETAQYAIYRDVDDQDMNRNGTLSDTDGDGEWTSTGIDVTGLNPGVYYVRVIFKDNNGMASGISPKSNRFFVLGNLTISEAHITYLDGMTQKINITGIQVDNTTSLDVFTYTIFDNTLKANTSISGPLNYDPTTQTWNASNVDVSTLPEGSYFVLGYFEDHSENLYGIGNTSSTILDLFTINHTIEVTQIYFNYTNEWAQLLDVGGLANTSFQGYGIGKPILKNESEVICQIYNSNHIYTGLSGTLNWTGISWNTTINVANLTEGAYYIQLSFINNSQIYNASGVLNSSYFWVDHILNITSISQVYVDDTAQVVSVAITANTSYCGAGMGSPIEAEPNASVLCTIVNNSNSELTGVSGYATWDPTSQSWTVNISTSSLPEGDYYVMVNFTVISDTYNATASANSTSFTIKHVLTLYVPTPVFNVDTATLDIIGIVATDTYSGYHHINDTTVRSTYFEIFNYTSKESLGIYGNLTYNATYDDWRNTSIDLSTYPEGLFFIFVNISSIDVPEGVAQNSSPFEIVHKIIISGISIEYTGGFQQTLNITVASATSTYAAHNSTDIFAANYRFYFKNNRTAVLNPDLSGNLSWTDNRWEGLANVSRLPAGEYYVVVNFADPTAANSKGSAETTNFTIVHIINVSTPVISYINGMNQVLNISCFVNSSYYYHRYFNSSSFGTAYYRIHLNNGSSTTLTGNLYWDGESWVVKNADVSLLPVGTYRIKCYFSTYYAENNSSLSDTFTVTHKITISSPIVSFDNQTNLLCLYNITALSSYAPHGYLTNSTALTAKFEIFDASNQSTGLTGSLFWNGTEWNIINYDLSSLADGSYYVKIYFNDSQTALTEISSDSFTISHPKEEFDWVIVTIILLAIMAVGIVLFWTFFTETPAERGKEI